MPAITGSFSGKVKLQTVIAVADQPKHELILVEIGGKQKSADEKWNHAPIRYWGATDVVDGKGNQRGYFVNDHGEDGRDWGTFEGKVATSNGVITVEGTFQFTGGSSKFKSITGNGTFKTKMSTPMDVHAAWQAAYELASAKAHAL